MIDVAVDAFFSPKKDDDMEEKVKMNSFIGTTRKENCLWKAVLTTAMPRWEAPKPILHYRIIRLCTDCVVGQSIRRRVLGSRLGLAAIDNIWAWLTYSNLERACDYKSHALFSLLAHPLAIINHPGLDT